MSTPVQLIDTLLPNTDIIYNLQKSDIVVNGGGSPDTTNSLNKPNAKKSPNDVPNNNVFDKRGKYLKCNINMLECECGISGSFSQKIVILRMPREVGRC